MESSHSASIETSTQQVAAADEAEAWAAHAGRRRAAYILRRCTAPFVLAPSAWSTKVPSDAKTPPDPFAWRIGAPFVHRNVAAASLYSRTAHAVDAIDGAAAEPALHVAGWSAA